MVNHRVISVRLRNQHFERIKSNAALNGFETVSEYIRSSLLADDVTLHQKVSEIYNVLLGNSPSQKRPAKEKPLTYFFKNKNNR